MSYGVTDVLPDVSNRLLLGFRDSCLVIMIGGSVQISDSKVSNIHNHNQNHISKEVNVEIRESSVANNHVVMTPCKSIYE